MKNVGSRIYFDKITGEVLVQTGHRRVLDDYVVPSVEDDFRVFIKLSERNPETVGVLELEYGQYDQDFAESNGYRVNPDTQELEFSYPNPNDPEAPPVFQKPLTQEIEELKQADIENKQAIAELTMMIAAPTA
ncbi:MAG: hypothetical protein LKI04_29175 [Paenibacillus lautus]|jgi:hypothetical protein|uniref:hypothetical protein n=1 Tax=Paenibacillus lautus TaxID=1401 RepID=UPI0026E95AE4|nr:hypothetical protein [Paenibacillus lautus]MCI1778094.1 hypothetical protein [Paenibacillus lautus]